MKNNDDYLTLANKRYEDSKQAKADKLEIERIKAKNRKELLEYKLEANARERRAKNTNSVIITIISVVSFIGLILICCAVGRGKL